MSKIEELHAELVRRLAKPGGEILAAMTADTAHLLHMVVGVAGETGELLDAIKRHAIYGKPLDIPNVIEELGDIEFYLEGIRSALLLTREACLAANAEKLGRRYSSGSYSDAQANGRADRKGGGA